MDYFEKYKDAKMCLYHMVEDLYYYYLDIEEAKKLNVCCNNEEIVKGNNIIVCYHQYNPYGLRMWELLKLKKPIITFPELCIARENHRIEKRRNIDYYDKYLDAGILIADEVLRTLSTPIPKEKAEMDHVRYNSEQDEKDDIVYVCQHNFLTSGQSAWRLFGIEDPIVGRSVIENIRKDFESKLINEEKAKVKEIGGYCE